MDPTAPDILDETADLQPPPVIKGNPRGIFDDNAQRKRKYDKKVKAQEERDADSELLLDIDKRLKTLIDKNRAVTKTYMDKAKAFEDDKGKSQITTESKDKASRNATKSSEKAANVHLDSDKT